MTVSATLASGPVMIYSGQEVGEPAKGVAGFNTGDGRTTIFDYWGVPEHQKWMNGGKFDGGRLSPEQRQLRGFYSRLLNLTASSDAIRRGKFYELQDANSASQGYDQKQVYSYLRYSDKQQVLVVVNFSRDQTMKPAIAIPPAALTAMGLNPQRRYTYTDLLNGTPATDNLTLTLAPLSAYVFEIKAK
jgi:glycosidase